MTDLINDVQDPAFSVGCAVQPPAAPCSEAKDSDGIPVLGQVPVRSMEPLFGCGDRGYYLGLGTNINAEQNAVLMLRALVKRFGPVHISRFYMTDPVGMKSAHRFLNFAARIETDLDPIACKSILVAIEVELGRDRQAPGCKTADRPADIDMMSAWRRGFPLSPDDLDTSVYMRASCLEILDFAERHLIREPADGVCPIEAENIKLGNQPLLVVGDDHIGLVCVETHS